MKITFNFKDNRKVIEVDPEEEATILLALSTLFQNSRSEKIGEQAMEVFATIRGDNSE